MEKKILHVLEGREKHITDTEVVRQSLPTMQFRFASPFIVLHHMPPKFYAAGSPEERLHPHPHRGFAPVTFMLQGQGFHRDNAGNAMTVTAGDVQWMFAGKGILHSEGPSPEFLAKGGNYELLQLWFNVPAANKWEDPYYQYVTGNEMPPVAVAPGVQLTLVSGDYENKTGPLKNFTPITAIWGNVEAGKEVTLTATRGYWTLLYIVDGQVTVNGTTVTGYHLVVFDKEDEQADIHIKADENTRLLYLCAEPINEPVAAKDNFVMNTAAETDQAIEDYKNGLFGQLEK
ncbi:pirin family protein [Chitinophaga nivalis]|uniref:Pirin family protein n=1 Tax=Chitinophaga nivalis TaxID=2991709 RepID=A0ABT3IIG0_9BACT|nr:pirin family protein [Chitinophaga nivalis]MCW3466570.1 pirin family protein [Chitinophaga nivalis]MCW3483739.1 pirin family protein [Chitinophaga nivalis]